jgi:hypothetical protein
MGAPGYYTPAGALPPDDLDAITAKPLTYWIPGSYVVTSDGAEWHWNAAAWIAGRAPGFATGATAGTPGTYTPAGTRPPASYTAITKLTATPTARWTTGQYVKAANNDEAWWDDNSWEHGRAVDVTLPQLDLTVTDQTDLTVTVAVSNHDPAGEVPDIDWDDGTLDDTRIHTYAAAGTYTLVASQQGRQDSDPVDVTVTAAPPVSLLDQLIPTCYGHSGGMYHLNTTSADANNIIVLYGPGKTPLPSMPAATAGDVLTPAVVGLTWAELSAEGAAQVSVTTPFVKAGPPATWTAAGNPVTWLYQSINAAGSTFNVALLDAGGATVHTYPPITLTPAI